MVFIMELFFFILVSIICFVPTHILAQQSPSPQCIDINFDSEPNLCRGIGTVRVPTTWNANFSRTFFAPNSDSFRTTTTVPMNNLKDIQQSFNQLFTLSSLKTWGNNLFGCDDITILHGRWYRAMTCSAFISMANSACPSPSPASNRLLCPDQAKEFWATWHQAATNPSNRCPNDVSNRVKRAYQSSSFARGLHFNNNCFTAISVEGTNSCGFPNAALACANSCRTPDFLAKAPSGLSVDIWCTAQIAAISTNPKPNIVPFLTPQSFDSIFPPPTTISTTATDKNNNNRNHLNPDGSPTTNSPQFNNTGEQDNTSFSDKKFAGIKGQVWLFGGIGVLVAATLVVIALVIRRRSHKINQSQTNYNNTRKGDNNEINPMGMLTANEKAIIIPSPQTFDNLSPPTLENINQMNQTNQNNNNNLSTSPDYPPTLPMSKEMTTNKNMNNTRPDTWNLVAKRVSTRPASIMPTNPIHPRPVILSYIPRLGDELEVHVGDLVAVWEEYGDGYGWGETHDGRQGVFPLMCLANNNNNAATSSSSSSPMVQLPKLPPPPMAPPPSQPLPTMNNNINNGNGNGIQNIMVNPQAHRFTQVTVVTDMDDNDDYIPYQPQQQFGGNGGHPTNPYNPSSQFTHR